MRIWRPLVLPRLCRSGARVVNDRASSGAEVGAIDGAIARDDPEGGEFLDQLRLRHPETAREPVEDDLTGPGEQHRCGDARERIVRTGAVVDVAGLLDDDVSDRSDGLCAM